MAPPREFWAGISTVAQLVKEWLARPAGVFASAAPQSASLPAESLVADSSDLLKRRMRALHLDPDDLVRAPARMANVKTGLCARCEARGKCLHDLDDEFADLGWGDWRNYCPNATALSLLSTLHGCEEEQDRVGQAVGQPV